MSVKAMILAAGKGTRVQPLTYDMPKPMIPVLGKPVMEPLIEQLARHKDRNSNRITRPGGTECRALGGPARAGKRRENASGTVGNRARASLWWWVGASVGGPATGAATGDRRPQGEGRRGTQM